MDDVLDIDESVSVNLTITPVSSAYQHIVRLRKINHMTRRDVLIKVLEAGFEKVDIDVFLKATAKPSIKKGKVDPAVVVSVDHVRRDETGSTQSSMDGQLVVNTEQPGTRETRGYGDLINSWTEQLTP